MSDLKMKKKNCKKVWPVIVDVLGKGHKLQNLTWNYDLQCSSTAAFAFLEELKNVEKMELKKITMVGVFALRENRKTIRQKFEGRNIVAELFVPDYTDDESGDHDDSEEESQPENEPSTTEEQEQEDLKWW